MTTTTNTQGAERSAFEMRCAGCGEPADLNSLGINIGDLHYHLACAPACASCGCTVHNGGVGWVVQGSVLSVPWGYAVRSTLVWCPDCVEAVPRAEPAAQD